MRVRAGYVTDEDIAVMAAEYGPRTTPCGRLRAVLEGRGGELVMTAAQARECDAIRRCWAGRSGCQEPGS